jgi:hypothetical protein
MNVRHIERLTGRDHRVYEVVWNPLDFNQIARALEDASLARP